jgi:hypothetical protein
MASTLEVYEGGMREKRRWASLEIEVPGEFTHGTNIDLGQDLGSLMWFRQGQQNHPDAVWSM